ncbi:hydroxyacid dehydrogenase [Amaricoccus sp. W119]|uniref:hydroxyacid dehydrogenase n=1 Tax=Amaricoccus sp. W119 TaxID=3391833 RepID=UPI0039A4CB41
MTDQRRKAKLVYFERWADDAAAEEILRDASHIEVQRLRYANERPRNDAIFAGAHGYQIQSRVELDEAWLGDADLLARAPNLLAISSTGSGYDVIDVEACTRAGVLVCNQTGGNARAVAEHAVGLMLALSKRIVMTNDAVRRAPDVDRFIFTGNNIEGKTVGILGIGNIGRITARICRDGFGMKVIAHDPYLDPAEIEARGATPVSRDALFAAADFISIHCPRTEETFGSIGLPEFSRMKPTAFFVNTARGGIHDEADLAQALTDRRLAGAGLDVFLEEPPAPDHPLLAFDNVIANPHIAGMSAESQTAITRYAASQWIEILAGRRPPRLVNPEAWPRFRDRFEDILGFAPVD